MTERERATTMAEAEPALTLTRKIAAVDARLKAQTVALARRFPHTRAEVALPAVRYIGHAVLVFSPATAISVEAGRAYLRAAVRAEGDREEWAMGLAHVDLAVKLAVLAAWPKLVAVAEANAREDEDALDRALAEVARGEAEGEAEGAGEAEGDSDV